MITIAGFVSLCFWLAIGLASAFGLWFSFSGFVTLLDEEIPQGLAASALGITILAVAGVFFWFGFSFMDLPLWPFTGTA